MYIHRDVHVYISIYLYIYIYIYTYTYIYMFICVYIYIYTYVHIIIQLCISDFRLDRCCFPPQILISPTRYNHLPGRQLNHFLIRSLIDDPTQFNIESCATCGRVLLGLLLR